MTGEHFIIHDYVDDSEWPLSTSDDELARVNQIMPHGYYAARVTTDTFKGVYIVEHKDSEEE